MRERHNRHALDIVPCQNVWAFCVDVVDVIKDMNREPTRLSADQPVDHKVGKFPARHLPIGAYRPNHIELIVERWRGQANIAKGEMRMRKEFRLITDCRSVQVVQFVARIGTTCDQWLMSDAKDLDTLRGEV